MELENYGHSSPALSSARDAKTWAQRTELVLVKEPLGGQSHS